MRKLDKKKVYYYMINKNDHNYNILKTIEELQELSLSLTQLLSKGIDEDKIIEEIGDVKIRMKILENLFPKKKIKERIKFKLEKYLNYIIENTYKNI